MFVDVSELKGLVIKVPTRTIDEQWLPITQKLKCTFLVKDASDIELIEASLSPETEYRILSAGIFGLVPDIHSSIKSMGLEPHQVAYITTNVQEIDWLYLERMGTILLDPENYDFDTTGGKLPDFHIDGVEELKNIVSRKYKGYYGEVRTTQVGRGPTWYGTQGYIIITSLGHDDIEIPVFASGRYYGTTHPRRAVHQLSVRISDSKRNNRQDELFTEVLGDMVRLIYENVGPVDGVTRVPPRPSAERDRLRPWIDNVCKRLNLTGMNDSLICVADYPSQKNLGRDERLYNIRGKFQADAAVHGKHVVLVDDVLTTGATVLECARMLYAQGASKVTLAVIALNQFGFSGANIVDEYAECEQCGERLVLKLTRENSAFYGCFRWSRDAPHDSASYVLGRQAILEKHTLDFEEDEDEVLF